MCKAMYLDDGCGLAAPQVGIDLNLLVLNPNGDPSDTAGELVLLNPKITKKKGREYDEEGCLSLPGIRAEVERWVHITISYQDLSGKEQTLQCANLLARIVQHELDHLDGVLFVDRLTAADKMRVRPLLERLERRYQDRKD